MLACLVSRLGDVSQGSKCASKGSFKKYLIKQEGGKFTKKVMKNDTGVGVQPKLFCIPFFGDTIFAPSHLSNRL